MKTNQQKENDQNILDILYEYMVTLTSYPCEIGPVHLSDKNTAFIELKNIYPQGYPNELEQDHITQTFIANINLSLIGDKSILDEIQMIQIKLLQEKYQSSYLGLQAIGESLFFHPNDTSYQTQVNLQFNYNFSYQFKENAYFIEKTTDKIQFIKE